MATEAHGYFSPHLGRPQSTAHQPLPALPAHNSCPSHSLQSLQDLPSFREGEVQRKELGNHIIKGLNCPVNQEMKWVLHP